jgi:hypothetical protein
MDHYEKHGSVSLTCRYFGMRWRIAPSRPHRRRQPTWTAALAEAVRMERERYQPLGEERIAPLLRA